MPNNNGLPPVGIGVPLKAATACAASRVDNGEAPRFHKRSAAATPKIATYNAISSVTTTWVGCDVSTIAGVGTGTVVEAAFMVHSSLQSIPVRLVMRRVSHYGTRPYGTRPYG